MKARAMPVQSARTFSAAEVETLEQLDLCGLYVGTLIPVDSVKQWNKKAPSAQGPI